MFESTTTKLTRGEKDVERNTIENLSVIFIDFLYFLLFFFSRFPLVISPWSRVHSRNTHFLSFSTNNIPNSYVVDSQSLDIIMCEHIVVVRSKIFFIASWIYSLLCLFCSLRMLSFGSISFHVALSFSRSFLYLNTEHRSELTMKIFRYFIRM